MKKSLRKKYEALGFVEALIAIMIAGISSVALMQIAVNTVQNAIQNEAIDQVTQYAVEGGTIVQDIANRNRTGGFSEGEELFPGLDDWFEGRCFPISRNNEGAFFPRDLADDNNFISYQSNLRDTYKDEAIIEGSNDLFRIVCLQIPGLIEGGGTVESTPHFLIGRVIVGQSFSNGTVTKGNLVRDYEYWTIIKL